MATYTEDDIVHFELPAREPRDDTDPRANERQFAFFDGTLFTNKARSEQRQVSEERDLALSPQTVDLSLHNLFDPLNDGDEGTFIVHIIGGGDPPSPTGLVTVTGRPEPPPAGREGVIDFDNQESLLSMFDLERADVTPKKASSLVVGSSLLTVDLAARLLAITGLTTPLSLTVPCQTLKSPMLFK